MISKYILLITSLHEAEHFLFHTVELFQTFLSNANNFIYYKSIACSQFNAFPYCNNVSLTIQLNIVYTQLNDQQFYFKQFSFALVECCLFAHR